MGGVDFVGGDVVEVVLVYDYVDIILIVGVSVVLMYIGLLVEKW